LLSLNTDVSKTLSLLVDCHDRPIIVCALGKSGYIAAKFAATLKSLDIKAEYLHASEALHGDLGSVNDNALVFLISHSGETGEVVSVAKESLTRGATCIGITAHRHSSLGLVCHECFVLPVRESVCRIGVAPMSSTTVSLVICDAVANILAYSRDTNINSFRKNHPGGKLGRSLSPVTSHMKPLDNFIVMPTVSIFDVLSKMSGTGFVVVQGTKVDDDVGIFTDGDLRRVLELELDVKVLSVGDYCSYSPLKVSKDMLVRDAEQLMDDGGVTSVLVSDHVGRVIGIYRK